MKIFGKELTFNGNKVYHAGNKPTVSEIGAAASSHTHNYAGSSSAGGAANSALTATKATQDSAGQQINKTYIKGLSVSGKTITYTKGDGTTGTITTQDTNTTYSTGTSSALGLTKLYTGTGTATDGTMTQAAINTALSGKAASSHTHNYAGSSSAGGAANSATVLATARTINGTSFNGSANITTANWGTARTLTIGNTGKSVNGSGNVSWSLSEIGAAPAGYGLGTVCQDKSGQDCNNILVTGFYRGSNMTNKPSGCTQGWIYLLVMSHDNSSWVRQVAYDFGTASQVYTRVKQNGSWTAWVATDTNTWRGVQDNLTSSATDQSLSANQGKILKSLIDGKAASSHTHNYAGSSSAGGAANSANTLTTARTINGTSFNGSANITTANWGTARIITIGSTGKSVNGSGSVSWTLHEIGAAPASHTHNYAGSSSAGGVANSATKLATARSINGTNFDGTGNITTANWGTARTITIGNTGKSVNGSGNISWSLSEIGAAAASHTHNYIPTSTGSSISIHADSDSSSTGEYLLLKAGHNELKITSSAGGATVTKGQDKLTFNGNIVYHAGRKPTAAEIGAASTSALETVKQNISDVERNTARANHTHTNITNIASRGNVTCESGTARPSVSGASMGQVYNNGYPTTYGNVLTLKGQGDGQLLLGWSGTDGAHAPVYVRSKRDTSTANWSGWAQVYTTAHKPTASDVGALPLSGGTMSGYIQLPNTGSSWIDGSFKGSLRGYRQSTGSYHPIITQTTSSGHKVSLGGLGDDFGFHVYDKNRTENGVDKYWRISLGGKDMYTNMRFTVQDDWLYTTGNTGWYNSTHAGGWYMSDSTWLRSYNDKNIYTGGRIKAGNALETRYIDSTGGNLDINAKGNTLFINANAASGANLNINREWSGSQGTEVSIFNNKGKGWGYLGNSNYSFYRVYGIGGSVSARESKYEILKADTETQYENVKALNIYNYRSISDERDEEGNVVKEYKRQDLMLGCMVDELPLETTFYDTEDGNGKAVDIYSYTTMIAGAVKHLIKKFEQLEKENEELKYKLENQEV